MGLCQTSESQAKNYNSKANKPRSGGDLKKGIVEEINNFRNLHGVPYLKQSSDLDSIAQSHAGKLANSAQLAYSGNKYRNQELGEILFYYGGECDAEKIVETWNKDSKNFKYNSKNPDASSFAQIVWKSSQLIGIGIAKDYQGGSYIVANFFPPGNIIGKFQDNVLPPKGKSRPARAKSRDPPARGNQNRIPAVKEDKSKRKRGNSNDKSSVFAGYNMFCAEALQSHNYYRAKHHSPPLRINKDLCKIAQSYAEKMLKSRNFKHSTNKYQGKEMGENLFMCNGAVATGEMATADWYNEIQMYNFNKDYQKGTGHFTQLIWKATTDVGFGVAYKGDLYYVVANYYPPGNFTGKFSQNVLRA